MGESSLTQHTGFRIPVSYLKKIDSEIVTGNYTRSDFINDAIREKLFPIEVEKVDLVEDSILKMKKSLEMSEKNTDVLLQFMNHFFRYFFIYHGEIEESLQKEAVASGTSRHQRFYNAFEKVLASQSQSFVHDLYKEEKVSVDS
jgi:Arc/MetJ-type ribon-helix-helix transcriptional regulator